MHVNCLSLVLRWRYALASLCVLTLLVGCGPKPLPVSDVQQATELINNTFENWKKGESLDDQKKKPTPVYVAEELWLNGNALKEFKLNGPGELFGTNVRFKVTLTLADKSGSSKNRDLKYLVTTTPACTVARDDR